MKILVTGGAGYIGSHTIVELLGAGHQTVAVDNFDNSSPAVFDRIHQITGQEVECVRLDVRDETALGQVFDRHQFDAVIHFAGLKAVGESVANPLRYYGNNLDTTLVLGRVMAAHNVKNIVFSSSATVYGDPDEVPIPETAPLRPANPYGRTKLVNEQILQDLAASDPAWQVTLLRYFNPVGAHPSGLIGEDPHGVPNNLMPFVTQVAMGKRDKLQVFGGDYDTPDGTGVRDYLHVVDLALGHVSALEKSRPGVNIYNLGTGRGVSVLEVVAAFEQASGRKIPYQVAARRPGDVPSYYADPTKATKELGWQAQKTLDDMCADSWRWQSKNPDGYRLKISQGASKLASRPSN